MSKASEALKTALRRFHNRIGKPVALPHTPGAIHIEAHGKAWVMYWTDNVGETREVSKKLSTLGMQIFIQGMSEGADQYKMTVPARNPVRKSRKGSTAREYVNRPSQATKRAPTKRLRKRRTVNVKRGRTGAFPNPNITGRRIRLF